MNDESRVRDAIGRTGRWLRETAAKSGIEMTQTQAEARVREARKQGDRDRVNNNR